MPTGHQRATRRKLRHRHIPRIRIGMQIGPRRISSIRKDQRTGMPRYRNRGMHRKPVTTILTGLRTEARI